MVLLCTTSRKMKRHAWCVTGGITIRARVAGVVSLDKHPENVCFFVLFDRTSIFDIRARGERMNEGCSFGASLVMSFVCVNSRPIRPLSKRQPKLRRSVIVSLPTGCHSTTDSTLRPLDAYDTHRRSFLYPMFGMIAYIDYESIPVYTKPIYSLKIQADDDVKTVRFR